MSYLEKRAFYTFLHLYFLSLRFFLYICIVYPCRKPERGTSKGGHIYIKGVTVRFGFDVIRTWKIQTVCQKQSNGNALWDVYIGHPELFL